jgi:hypothetical protein
MPKSGRFSSHTSTSSTKQPPRTPRGEVARARAATELEVMCRSCGKRPGKPTSLPGQMMQAELCAVCAALRKERIKANRAAARSRRDHLH